MSMDDQPTPFAPNPWSPSDGRIQMPAKATPTEGSVGARS